MAHIVDPRLLWTPADLPGLTDRLSDVLASWEGTPYESGQRFIQRGADCIGAVFGVIDDLDGRARAEFPGMPHDVALHNGDTARAALRDLIRRYQPISKVPQRADGIYCVEPGDLVVTGHPGGGPGHVEIVGVRPGHLWHSLPDSGFHRGGWSLFDTQVLFAIYRIEDKERWVS